MRCPSAIVVLSVAGLSVGLGVAPVAADVVASAPSGFFIRNEALIDAAKAAVYEKLTDQIDKWWDPAHTFSGDAANLTLDPSPGGCFCETFPDGGGVVHMTVIYVSPGEAIRLSGGLGPLQEAGLVGSMTWTLHDQNDSTRVEMTYGVGGFLPGDIDAVAPVVDAVLLSQLTRLKNYVETGDPAP